MANRIRAVVAARWTRTARANDQELPNLVTQRPNDSFSDITGQADSRIGQLLANVYLCEVDVVSATAAEIAALPGVFVLAQETYDDVTGVVSSGNFDSTLTAGQRTAAADALKARFPGLDDEKLKRAGQTVFRAGRTRRQIIDDLKQVFNAL